ncbi:MAG: MFS transporter [Pseudomonadota bacterium]
MSHVTRSPVGQQAEPSVEPTPISAAATSTRWSSLSLSRALYLGALMLAGEYIYMLPYMRRSFQTTMEQAFQVNALELGLINSMFGILALVCYLPGGWLADRFAARQLLVVSLVATGLGGLFLLTSPSFPELLLLHAAWGITSVLTFWAALIKATRAWGGADQQGLSFGLLDGGRGLVAAILVTIATIVFAYADTPGDGLNSVIALYTAMTFFAALVVWLCVREDALGLERIAAGGAVNIQQAGAAAGNRPQENATSHGSPAGSLQRLRAVMSRRSVWLLAVVVFAAFFLYLGTYEFAAYAERGYGQSALFGAQLSTVREWMRPVAAVAAGLLADRFLPSVALQGAFVLLLVCYAALAMISGEAGFLIALWVPVVGAAVAVFALRGVYYAALEETRVPLVLTGSAVGLVSLVGYLPDVFAPTLAGWFAVTFPGGEGYRMYFGLLCVISVLGFFASRALGRSHAGNDEKDAQS